MDITEQTSADEADLYDEEDDVFTEEVEQDDDPYELTEDELAELADEEEDEDADANEDSEEQPPEQGEDADVQGDGSDDTSVGATNETNGGADGEGGGAGGDAADAKSDTADMPMDYAKMAADDLAIINRTFPGLGLTDLRKIDNPGRYGAMRDMGLSPEEAFRATNHERIRAHTAAAERARADSKSHIRGDMPKKQGSADDFSLSAKEMREARELFPDKSDKEITALYRSVSKRK